MILLKGGGAPKHEERDKDRGPHRRGTFCDSGKGLQHLTSIQDVKTWWLGNTKWRSSDARGIMVPASKHERALRTYEDLMAAGSVFWVNPLNSLDPHPSSTSFL